MFRSIKNEMNNFIGDVKGVCEGLDKALIYTYDHEPVSLSAISWLSGVPFIYSLANLRSRKLKKENKTIEKVEITTKDGRTSYEYVVCQIPTVLR